MTRTIFGIAVDFRWVLVIGIVLFIYMVLRRRRVP